MRKAIIILLALLIVLRPIKADAKALTDEYKDYIEAVSDTYSLCPELVEALIFYESGNDAKATNGSCIGLGQINKSAHKDRMKRLGVTDLTNGYQNILVTCDYLAELYEKYEDNAKVLDAYRGALKSDSWYEAGNMSKYANKILSLSEEKERTDGK